MKSKHAFYISTWQKDPLFFLKYFRSCKAFSLFLKSHSYHIFLKPFAIRPKNKQRFVVVQWSSCSCCCSKYYPEYVGFRRLFSAASTLFTIVWLWRLMEICWTIYEGKKLWYTIWNNANLIFSQYNMVVESSELFVNCLEAMVETCLPVEENQPVPSSPRPYNLTSSLSSLTLGSPDKGSTS